MPKFQIEAINKWMYFTWNFGYMSFEGNDYVPAGWYPEFLIETKWNCPLPHMVSKWQQACNATNDAHAIFSRFYAELGIYNRRALLEWILDNYDDECKIF